MQHQISKKDIESTIVDYDKLYSNLQSLKALACNDSNTKKMEVLLEQARGIVMSISNNHILKDQVNKNIFNDVYSDLKQKLTDAKEFFDAAIGSQEFISKNVSQKLLTQLKERILEIENIANFISNVKHVITSNSHFLNDSLKSQDFRFNDEIKRLEILGKELRELESALLFHPTMSNAYSVLRLFAKHPNVLSFPKNKNVDEILEFVQLIGVASNFVKDKRANDPSDYKILILMYLTAIIQGQDNLSFQNIVLAEVYLLRAKLHLKLYGETQTMFADIASAINSQGKHNSLYKRGYLIILEMFQRMLSNLERRIPNPLDPNIVNIKISIDKIKLKISKYDQYMLGYNESLVSLEYDSKITNMEIEHLLRRDKGVLQRQTIQDNPETRARLAELREKFKSITADFQRYITSSPVNSNFTMEEKEVQFLRLNNSPTSMVGVKKSESPNSGRNSGRRNAVVDHSDLTLYGKNPRTNNDLHHAHVEDTISDDSKKVKIKK